MFLTVLHLGPVICPQTHPFDMILFSAFRRGSSKVGSLRGHFTQLTVWSFQHFDVHSHLLFPSRKSKPYQSHDTITQLILRKLNPVDRNQVFMTLMGIIIMSYNPLKYSADALRDRRMA
jgi:hypothetical protein